MSFSPPRRLSLSSYFSLFSSSRCRVDLWLAARRLSESPEDQKFWARAEIEGIASDGAEQRVQLEGRRESLENTEEPETRSEESQDNPATPAKPLVPLLELPKPSEESHQPASDDNYSVRSYFAAQFAHFSPTTRDRLVAENVEKWKILEGQNTNRSEESIESNESMENEENQENRKLDEYDDDEEEEEVEAEEFPSSGSPLVEDSQAAALEEPRFLRPTAAFLKRVAVKAPPPAPQPLASGNSSAAAVTIPQPFKLSSSRRRPLTVKSSEQREFEEFERIRAEAEFFKARPAPRLPEVENPQKFRTPNNPRKFTNPKEFQFRTASRTNKKQENATNTENQQAPATTRGRSPGPPIGRLSFAAPTAAFLNRLSSKRKASRPPSAVPTRRNSFENLEVSDCPPIAQGKAAAPLVSAPGVLTERRAKIMQKLTKPTNHKNAQAEEILHPNSEKIVISTNDENFSHPPPKALENSNKRVKKSEAPVPFQLATDRRGEFSRARFESKILEQREAAVAATTFRAHANPHPSPSTAAFLPRKSVGLTRALSPRLLTAQRQRTLSATPAPPCGPRDFVF